jgi:hypothetical protein
MLRQFNLISSRLSVPDIRPGLFSAHLPRSGIEPGDGPIHLPQLHVMAVDEPPGRFDGCLIVEAIQLDHSDGTVM